MEKNFPWNNASVLQQPAKKKILILKIITIWLLHFFYFCISLFFYIYFIFPFILFIRGTGFFQISFKDIAQCLAGIPSAIFKPHLLLNPISLHSQPEDFKSPAQQQVAFSSK